MAVASFRRRAGMNEIKNKERKIKEKIKAMRENTKKEEVSEEEHKRRMEMLKRLGVV